MTWNRICYFFVIFGHFVRRFPTFSNNYVLSLLFEGFEGIDIEYYSEKKYFLGQSKITRLISIVAKPIKVVVVVVFIVVVFVKKNQVQQIFDQETMLKNLYA